jgi:hypothetical protein
VRIRFVHILSIAFVVLVAGCGGGTTSDTAATTTSAASSSTTTTTAPTTTTTAATTTTAQTTTTIGSSAPFEINGDREVTIDWAALAGVFFAAPVPNADDPLFHVHNNPATDGFFLGVEAYTVYGPGWTGQLGTFDIDCAENGFCLHFDADGSGPESDLGADFMVTGTIEILRADIDGFEAILTDVAFTDGTTIPGPLRVTGGAA